MQNPTSTAGATVNKCVGSGLLPSDLALDRPLRSTGLGVCGTVDGATRMRACLLRTLRTLVAVSLPISAVMVGASGWQREAGAFDDSAACAEAGEVDAGESIASPSGRYGLTLRRNGNLVLYDYLGRLDSDSSDGIAALLATPLALWSSNSSGIRDARLVMEPDGDLVLYGRFGMRTQPAWNTRTQGWSGAVLQVCDDGTMRVSLPAGRVLWTAGTSTPTAGPMGEKHVVFDRDAQRVWLMAADGRLFDTYPVSGRLNTPGPGRYSVYSKSPTTVSFTGTSTMKHMVRFTYGVNGYAIGFHSIPRSFDGQPVQSLDQLGEALGAGCVRQQDSKAEQLYDWVPVGTPIIVVG